MDGEDKDLSQASDYRVLHGKGQAALYSWMMRPSVRKRAHLQQKADSIETARQQDLTSSYPCRQQKSKLGVHNPSIVKDPVYQQAVSQCPNQPVEERILGQAEGSLMVRKTEQTCSTKTYSLRNRQRVLLVLAGYTPDKLQTL